MRPTYLPLAIKAAALGVADALPLLLAGGADHRVALYVSDNYRRMAVGFLLLFGTPDRFFEHLFRSARSYLFFLQTSGEDAKTTSKAAPFFDAIACNDMDGAASMARSARAAWRKNKEYEEDFLYMCFLMRRFFGGPGSTSPEGLLKRYEAVVNGAPDLRLDLCKALLTRDQRLFDGAVNAFIEAHREQVARLRTQDRLNPDDAATTVHVSTELLAWLHFGEEVGLRCAPEYALAPGPARRLDRAPPRHPDAWRTIEAYAELSQ